MTRRAIQEWHPATRNDADAAIAYAMDAGWLVELAGALRPTRDGIELGRLKPRALRNRGISDRVR